MGSLAALVYLQSFGCSVGYYVLWEDRCARWTPWTPARCCGMAELFGGMNGCCNKQSGISKRIRQDVPWREWCLLK